MDLVSQLACFSTSDLTDDNSFEIIRALDINKVHGHDEIFVGMMK